MAKPLYDGGQILAEYSATGSLLCKYIYGPGVDQPICALRRVDTVVEYYHFDGLDSLWLSYVVALSDLWLSYADGDTIQTYEYTVYGEVAAEDANHPNRFLFTGREFDKETGLYYYRARYYNPALGRFLQTDPAGYKAGMNLYAYCMNDPVSLVDSFGTDPTGLTSNPKWTPYYAQDCEMSCVAAAIQNVLYLLGVSPAMIPAESEIRSALEDAQDEGAPSWTVGPHSEGNRWNWDTVSHGVRDDKYTVDVLNKYLDIFSGILWPVRPGDPCHPHHYKLLKDWGESDLRTYLPKGPAIASVITTTPGVFHTLVLTGVWLGCPNEYSAVFYVDPAIGQARGMLLSYFYPQTVGGLIVPAW